MLRCQTIWKTEDASGKTRSQFLFVFPGVREEEDMNILMDILCYSFTMTPYSFVFEDSSLVRRSCFYNFNLCNCYNKLLFGVLNMFAPLLLPPSLPPD